MTFCIRILGNNVANVYIAQLFNDNPLTVVVDPGQIIWPVSDLSQMTPHEQAKGINLAFLDARYAGGAGVLLANNNLSDVADPAEARQNLDLGSAAQADAGDFANAAQGDLAESAVQPGDLAAVAFSGDYGDLVNPPALGQLAAEDWPPIDNQAYVAQNGAWAVATLGGASLMVSAKATILASSPSSPAMAFALDTAEFFIWTGTDWYTSDAVWSIVVVGVGGQWDFSNSDQSGHLLTY